MREARIRIISVIDTNRTDYKVALTFLTRINNSIGYFDGWGWAFAGIW